MAPCVGFKVLNWQQNAGISFPTEEPLPHSSAICQSKTLTRKLKNHPKTSQYMWVFSKNSGKTSKMDGENNGKSLYKMDDLGGKTPLFSETLSCAFFDAPSMGR